MTLKLKTTDFQLRTRAQTINSYTSDAEVIFAAAQGILRAEIQAELPKPLRLRLMGKQFLSAAICVCICFEHMLGFERHTEM